MMPLSDYEDRQPDDKATGGFKMQVDKCLYALQFAHVISAS